MDPVPDSSQHPARSRRRSVPATHQARRSRRTTPAATLPGACAALPSPAPLRLSRSIRRSRQAPGASPRAQLHHRPAGPAPAWPARGTPGPTRGAHYGSGIRLMPAPSTVRKQLGPFNPASAASQHPPPSRRTGSGAPPRPSRLLVLAAPASPSPPAAPQAVFCGWSPSAARSPLARRRPGPVRRSCRPCLPPAWPVRVAPTGPSPRPTWPFTGWTRCTYRPVAPVGPAFRRPGPLHLPVRHTRRPRLPPAGPSHTRRSVTPPPLRLSSPAGPRPLSGPLWPADAQAQSVAPAAPAFRRPGPSESHLPARRPGRPGLSPAGPAAPTGPSPLSALPSASRAPLHLPVRHTCRPCLPPAGPSHTRRSATPSSLRLSSQADPRPLPGPL